MTYEDYAKRAVELGHSILSSCEHGWQGRYIECHDLAKQYGLKFLFAAEAYWVWDRHEEDRSNCHIWIGAKNENGREWINEVLSQANEDGFYYQPRLDEELLDLLPAGDVWITTACVAGWKYLGEEEEGSRPSGRSCTTNTATISCLRCSTTPLSDRKSLTVTF